MAKHNLLQEELRTFESNKTELIKEHNGEYALIKGEKIISTFETENDAIKTGIKMFGNTPFLVKKIEEIEQPQNFTSNLIRCDLKCHQ